jgi:hypothetical protein
LGLGEALARTATAERGGDGGDGGVVVVRVSLFAVEDVDDLRVEGKKSVWKRRRRRGKRETHLVVIRRLLARVARDVPAPLSVREEPLTVALSSSVPPDMPILRVRHIPTPVPKDRLIEPVQRVLKELALSAVGLARRGRAGRRSDDAVRVKVFEDGRGEFVDEVVQF